jgi:hypothetical protein
MIFLKGSHFPGKSNKRGTWTPNASSPGIPERNGEFKKPRFLSKSVINVQFFCHFLPSFDVTYFFKVVSKENPGEQLLF